ncbi:hypothetical protein IQ07DRAFT_636724 [Pyrenochaeta sp. DS3sAY3a]|nr:hypothetical protein IQ07DRAFT_636724 [Pyrenochaeta sp. DS3sAY3a]
MSPEEVVLRRGLREYFRGQQQEREFLIVSRRTPACERHQLHNAHVAHRSAAYRPPALYLNFVIRDSRAGYPGAEDDGVDGQGGQVGIRTLNEPGSESSGVTGHSRKFVLDSWYPSSLRAHWYLSVIDKAVFRLGDLLEFTPDLQIQPLRRVSSLKASSRISAFHNFPTVSVDLIACVDEEAVQSLWEKIPRPEGTTMLWNEKRTRGVRLPHLLLPWILNPTYPSRYKSSYECACQNPACVVALIQLLHHNYLLQPIRLWPVFSFRRNFPPISSFIPKNFDSSKELYLEKSCDHARDSHPFRVAADLVASRQVSVGKGEGKATTSAQPPAQSPAQSGAQPAAPDARTCTDCSPHPPVQMKQATSAEPKRPATTHDPSKPHARYDSRVGYWYVVSGMVP